MHAKYLRRWTLLALGLVIASSLACSVLGSTDVEDDAQTAAGEAGGEAVGNTLPELVGANQLDLESVAATGEGIQGEVLMVQLTNPGSDEVLVTIPCGYFFSPADDEEQRLMVIQPAGVTIPAGGTATIEPYVICIDSGRAGPEASSTYHLGEIATGDLLKLAQCLCEEELLSPEDPTAGMDILGVQFAVWAVSDGIFGSEMQEAQGVLQDMLGSEFADAFDGQFAEMMQQMMDMFGGGAQSWLDSCGIEIDTQAP